MRREICGECDTPINHGGSCICTELPKQGWRQCAKGQQTTQWCAMAETLLREQRQRDEALLRQALEEAEEAMRFVHTSCATFPQEPQHVQNTAWRRIVNAITKARTVLGRGGLK